MQKVRSSKAPTSGVEGSGRRMGERRSKSLDGPPERTPSKGKRRSDPALDGTARRSNASAATDRRHTEPARRPSGGDAPEARASPARGGNPSSAKRPSCREARRSGGGDPSPGRKPAREARRSGDGAVLPVSDGAAARRSGRGASLRSASDARDARARAAASKEADAGVLRVAHSRSFRRTALGEGGGGGRRRGEDDYDACRAVDGCADSAADVGDAYLRRRQPRDWLCVDRGCGGLWCASAPYRCRSHEGNGGAADGVAAAWSARRVLGRGLHRVTYLGTYVSGPKKGRRCVVKKLLEGGRSEEPPPLVELDLGIGDAAIALAGEFNEAMAGTRTRALRFNRGLALTVASAGGRSGFARGEWVTVEDFYPGPFEKLVANTGLVAYENNRGSLATFCHWTYDRTRGAFIVTDVQGVRPRGDELYLLTDAAIHSASGDRGAPRGIRPPVLGEPKNSSKCSRRSSHRTRFDSTQAGVRSTTASGASSISLRRTSARRGAGASCGPRPRTTPTWSGEGPGSGPRPGARPTASTGPWTRTRTGPTRRNGPRAGTGKGAPLGKRPLTGACRRRKRG